MLENHQVYLFESERLGFRYWEIEDSVFYISLCQNSDVMKFFPKLLSDQDAVGEMFYLDDQLRDNGYGSWAVEEKLTKTLIGTIGIQKVPFEAFFTPAMEIGWRIATKYWKQGFAIEGAERVLLYMKQANLGNKLVSFTAKNNISSQAVMKKLKMSYVSEFNHPKLDKDHPLSVHILYEKYLQ